MTPEPWLHHVALTVTDLDTATEWYRRVLGLDEPVPRDGPTWRRVLLRAASGGFALSLSVHDATGADDRFDPARVGMDHLAIGCRSREELDRWVAHLDGLGIDHAAVTEAPHAHLVACHDPDGIPVEFYWLVG